MRTVENERGSVFVFATLIIVLLLIMVGMGLDTGVLTYVRSQGQPAVDAAALSAASGLPSKSDAQVKSRAAAFNSINDYVEGATNKIGDSNITYVKYDPSKMPTIEALPSINGANGVRVALEQNNPHTGNASNTGITTPVFLTPLLKLFGAPAKSTADISVSAVAVLAAEPSIPIAIYQDLCNGSTKVRDVQLLTQPSTTDNSCWTTYWDPPVSKPNVTELFKASQTCSGVPNGVAGGGEIYLGNGVVSSVYTVAKNFFQKTKNDNPCWIIPVVPAGSSCNRTDPIKDWAQVCPTKVYRNASTPDDQINTDTKDRHYIIADVTCNQKPLGSSDALCFRPRLVRDAKSGM